MSTVNDVTNAINNITVVQHEAEGPKCSAKLGSANGLPAQSLDQLVAKGTVTIRPDCRPSGAAEKGVRGVAGAAVSVNARADGTRRRKHPSSLSNTLSRGESEVHGEQAMHQSDIG